MEKRRRLWIALGLAVLLLTGVVIGLVSRNARIQQTPGPTVDPLVTVIDLSSAPADVQAAAAKLKTSRVGYAIVHPDKTYLIISTGSDGVKVKFDHAEGQPLGEDPTFVDVHLTSDAAGQRLLVATTELGAGVEYQFNLDGYFAAIPTLRNLHNLPLVHLNADTRFSVIEPVADQLVEGGVLHLTGYAQVFEAAFTVTVTTSKGRPVGFAPVQTAGGAPSWGSFVADVTIETTSLTETGFVILEEGMTEARVVIPIRFRRPPQLG